MIYSDGLVEHENTELDNYFPQMLIKDPSELKDTIEELHKHKFEDDVTLLKINNLKK